MNFSIKSNVYAFLFLSSLAPLSSFAQFIDLNSKNVDLTMNNETSKAPVFLHSVRGAVGEYLTDWMGRSVYAFTLDQNNLSNCGSACADTWMPLTVPDQHLRALEELSQNSDVGAMRREDGRLQLTLNGTPLYVFAQDKTTGDINGHGLESTGGKWFLLRPNGTFLQEKLTAPTFQLDSARSNLRATSHRNFVGEYGGYGGYAGYGGYGNSGYGNSYGYGNAGYDYGNAGYDYGNAGYGYGNAGYGYGNGGYGYGNGGYGYGNGGYDYTNAGSMPGVTYNAGTAGTNGTYSGAYANGSYGNGYSGYPSDTGNGYGTNGSYGGYPGTSGK